MHEQSRRADRRSEDAGSPAGVRKYGISDATFSKWRSRYGGIEGSDARRLKALKDENRRLKKLLAESMLEHIAVGKPMQNGFVERLNGRLWDECLMSTCSAISTRRMRLSKHGGSTTIPTGCTRTSTGSHQLASEHAPIRGITGTDFPFERGHFGEQVKTRAKATRWPNAEIGRHHSRTTPRSRRLRTSGRGIGQPTVALFGGGC